MFRIILTLRIQMGVHTFLHASCMSGANAPLWTNSLWVCAYVCESEFENSGNMSLIAKLILRSKD